MDGKPAGMTANVPHGTIKFSRKEELCVAKIVAIANQKGGVGKTTTAVNLSSCVAALGKRVLIVDLDPQGNTTTGYGIPKRSVEKGTYEILYRIFLHPDRRCGSARHESKGWLHLGMQKL